MPKSRDPITCQNHYTHADFYMLFLRLYLSFFVYTNITEGSFLMIVTNIYILKIYTFEN